MCSICEQFFNKKSYSHNKLSGKMFYQVDALEGDFLIFLNNGRKVECSRNNDFYYVRFCFFIIIPLKSIIDT